MSCFVWYVVRPRKPWKMWQCRISFWVIRYYVNKMLGINSETIKIQREIHQKGSRAVLHIAAVME